MTSKTLKSKQQVMSFDEEEAEDTSETQALNDDQLLCLLTGKATKANEKELNLQSLIRMLSEEYGFELSQMERDFTVTGETDAGKKWKRKVELVLFAEDQEHSADHAIRLCVVQDSKTKETDLKKGVQAVLENVMAALPTCEFGLWTNGLRYVFLQQKVGSLGQTEFEELSDFPGKDETLGDLDRSDKNTLRNPANDSLIRTFKRCHDYIYGNEGHQKTAFWQLLNLIFCKIYDEKCRYLYPDRTYRRRFWVGVKENNTKEGQAAVAKRIKELFEELKTSPDFTEVFRGNEEIELTDRGLGFVAAELAKYSFLDATVDVKGMAYETIVSNTLKQERGQFFTPRNIVRAMVEMMDPQPGQRVLDPACGSGGFLVMVLDRVRRTLAKQLFPDAKGIWLEEKFNHPDVNEAVRQYAHDCLFGIDFDPDLKRAARMNMVMAGDGHANIFHFNSLEYPKGANTPDIEAFQEQIARSLDALDDEADTDQERHISSALGKFDLIFTNPPFGSKIPITDKDILGQYDFGFTYRRNDEGQFERSTSLTSSQPPEILFVDRCYQFLKPGGRMALVLPDGILGNPNTEWLRAWILERFRVLASIDLPVEAFLPQVGVQASLLFLEKRTETERSRAEEFGPGNYDVFMAIAEKLGKDRRGVPIYERDDDGAEILTEKTVRYLHYDPKQGRKVEKSRTEKTPDLDDDLPKITAAYQRFLTGEKL